MTERPKWLQGVINVIKTPSYAKRELIPTFERFNGRFNQLLGKAEERIKERKAQNQ